MATALLAPASSPMCEAWGIPPWIWLWMLYFGPAVSETSYNVQPWTTQDQKAVKDKPETHSLPNWRFFVYMAITGAMAFWGLRPLLADKRISGTGFFVIYLGKLLF